MKNNNRESTSLIGALRLPFLLLTPACLSLGWVLAYRSGQPISILDSILVLVGALSAHVSVNTFNEYFDFKSGLDLLTERTPFSGGSGTLPQNPQFASAVLFIACLSFGLTALVGLYFVFTIGWGLLPLGLAGLATVLFYTTFITRYPALCLLAPGLGFGPLMVMGTVFVLSGDYSWSAFTLSLVPFFLVNNLLLLNQFPDTEADSKVGRKNIPITLGRRGASLVYALFTALAFVTVLMCATFNLFPKGALWGLLTLLIAVPTVRGVLRNAENPQGLLPWMKFNVLLSLATPSLITVGILLSN